LPSLSSERALIKWLGLGQAALGVIETGEPADSSYSIAMVLAFLAAREFERLLGEGDRLGIFSGAIEFADPLVKRAELAGHEAPGGLIARLCTSGTISIRLKVACF
jgi:hypothetical protein